MYKYKNKLTVKKGMKYFVNSGLNLALIGNYAEKDKLEEIVKL